jgi:hypothetical protein
MASFSTTSRGALAIQTTRPRGDRQIHPADLDRAALTRMAPPPERKVVVGDPRQGRDSSVTAGPGAETLMNSARQGRVVFSHPLRRGAVAPDGDKHGLCCGGLGGQTLPVARMWRIGQTCRWSSRRRRRG